MNPYTELDRQPVNAAIVEELAGHLKISLSIGRGFRERELGSSTRLSLCAAFLDLEEHRLSTAASAR